MTPAAAARLRHLRSKATTCNRFLVVAFALALTSAVLAFIAIGTDQWTVGSSPGDTSYFGLRRLCLIGAVITIKATDTTTQIPTLCAEWNRTNAVLLLTFLGDTLSQANEHYRLFLVAKTCMVAGAALAVIAAVACLIGVFFLYSRWLLVPLVVLSSGALLLQALAPLFWGLLQTLALSKLEDNYPTELGRGWHLAIAAVVAALLSAMFVALGSCGRSLRKDRRNPARTSAGDATKDFELVGPHDHHHQHQHQAVATAQNGDQGGTGLAYVPVEQSDSTPRA